jgi:hypothetical protein
MTHIHWVPRQNKLEILHDEEEVNTREIHKCDGKAHDPDTMVAPLTPKPTRKTKVLTKAPPTIASRHEEDTALKKWPKPRLCCANDIPETTFLKLKQTTEAPQRKSRTHVPTQIPRRFPPHPNHTPIHHTSAMGKRATQG